ncbi:MAG: SDR family oxidoreductase, partial [Chloroflexota bacterium]
MKVIVITGSTRGIGYGLAGSFLDLGCAVVISGRRQEAVDKALGGLSKKASQGPVEARLSGYPCDVTVFEQVQALWDQAKAKFGRVDIWINNAGSSNSLNNFWDLSPELIRSVVETNLVGAMYGSQVALRGMLAQGEGAIYNMEGLGSDSRRSVRGLALYGSTKAGLSYFNNALVDETRDGPVLVGSIRPGMVLTDMLLDREYRSEEERARAMKVFNIIADR